MALFRRRSVPDEPAQDELEAADLAADEGGDAAEAAVTEGDPDGGSAEEAASSTGAGWDRSSGPYDESERDLADPEVPRLDLGSLLIPGLPGIGVQVEADPKTQEVRAITAVGDDGAVQLQAFAAPRSEGLWDEIRGEMLAEISNTRGARVKEEVGPFGPELQAVLPARTPDGRAAQQPLRFAGIDGPRWFLRAVFLGPAAMQPDPQDDLHRLVRETIVIRGGEAMAPRDPLPLRLPEQPPAEAEGAGSDEDVEPDEALDDDLAVDEHEDDETGAGPNKYADLNPFERGPEITEIR